MCEGHEERAEHRRLSHIERRLGALERKERTIMGQLEDLNAAVAAAQQAAADAKAAADAVSTRVSTDLSNFAAQVKTLQDEVTALQGQASPDLAPAIASLGELASGLQATAQELSGVDPAAAPAPPA